MPKGPTIAVFVSLVFFGILYFGLSNVAPTRKAIDQTRQATGTVSDANTLIEEVKQLMSPAQLEQLRQLTDATVDTSNTEALKKLSSWWVSIGKPEIAGLVAKEVALKEQTAGAWSIAGASLHMGINHEKASAKARTFCAEEAKKAFENAISLEPENAEHRINLALVYADAPSENPMQAVQMLRDLEAKYPENPAVYNALGRLAIKTNQWDRALQRLEKAFSLDPKNKNTICLLAIAYEGKGDLQKADTFAKSCKSTN